MAVVEKPNSYKHRASLLSSLARRWGKSPIFAPLKRPTKRVFFVLFFCFLGFFAIAMENKIQVKASRHTIRQAFGSMPCLIYISSEPIFHIK